MSKKYNLRKNKTCLNCSAFVNNRYCPQCGQINKESRESFFHLFTEFAADLVHYDSSFWTTIRYLLFSPAKLSVEYMQGKRKSYVNPVKLYIFISFITFFIPAILPSNEGKEEPITMGIKYSNPIQEIEGEDTNTKDSTSTYISENDTTDNSIRTIIDPQKALYIEGYGTIRSSEHLDSIHNSKPSYEQLPYLMYLKYKCIFNYKKNTSDRYAKERAYDFITDSLPKVLMIYMPLFAFWIWLMNLKKRKYYFDSGIFTLHFFSFVLLLITLFNITLHIPIIEKFTTYTTVALLLYITFYFFRANRTFYSDRRRVANAKAIFLVVINTIFIIITLIAFLIIAAARSY